MAFKKDFLWGTATASAQVEGAYLEDGKCLTIWDATTDGHIKNGDDAKIACDHYHRYQDDIDLLKQIGTNCYRFSISWARIFTDQNTVNPKGIEFYNKVIDKLIQKGIQPMVTLFHWDLPMWAYNQGGWKNPQIVEWFANYTKVVVEAFSDRVKYWITLNEPQCFIGLGYKSGIHAPFEKNTPAQLQDITINVMYTHGKAVDTIRKYAKQKPLIGYAPTSSTIVPKSDNASDVEFARKETFNIDRTGISCTAWWSDAIVLGQVCKGMEFLQKADMSKICKPLDFYAYNVYVSSNQDVADVDWNKKPGMPKTALEWEIMPSVMYWSAKFFYERYKLPLIISENGMANIDFVMSDGKVHDPQRCEFIKLYLTQLKKATDQGIPIDGYLYWSALDNFEWAIGYLARFGLIHVDFTTQKRTLKDSAYYYKQIIESNGEIL